MQSITLLAPFASLAALIFAGIMAYVVIKKPQGNEAMIKISTAIKEGADAYLKIQYRGVALFFGLMFILLSALAYFKFITPFVPFAFVSGGFFPVFPVSSA